MKKAVLFVDDHQALCRFSCDILRHAGYHAVPAYSAAEALQVFDSMRFDIVVTDVRMAGMDGVELARTIRDKAPTLPIIVVSGHGPVEAGDLTVCIPKRELFPALLKQMRVCLSGAESGSQSPAS